MVPDAASSLPEGAATPPASSFHGLGAWNVEMPSSLPHAPKKVAQTTAPERATPKLKTRIVVLNDTTATF